MSCSTLRSDALGLAAGAAAACLVASSPAFAQDYNPYAASTPYSSGPTESVTVIAPRFRADSTPLNGPLEKVSLSEPVRFTDRDLLSREGTRALRRRVWRTAEEVCGRLADAYPVYTLATAEPCLKEAYENAMVKVRGQVAGVRLAYWYGY